MAHLKGRMAADGAWMYVSHLTERMYTEWHMRFIALEHHPNDSRIKIAEDGICQSLSARMGTGGNNVPLVLQINERTDSFGIKSESRNHNE